MARITIEDCTEKVPNRFQLVQMAAIRSKQLKKGATALLVSEDNKEVVMSLREIAAGYVRPDYPGESDEATAAEDVAEASAGDAPETKPAE